MFYTTDTTSALVRARNDGLSLRSVKREADQDAGSNGIGSVIESLAAVIPTGITSIYTATVLVIRGLAIERGAEEHAELQAAWLAAGRTRAQIEDMLAALPIETTEWITGRWFMLIVSASAVAVAAGRAAFAGNRSAKRKRSALRLILAEPLAALLAFAGWSLSVPGTPMAAHLNADDLLAFTVLVPGGIAIVLLTMGRLTLTKKAVASERTG